MLQVGSPQEQKDFIRMLKKHRNPKAGHYTLVGLMKLPLPKLLKQKRAGWMWHRSGDLLDPSISWHRGQPNNSGGSQSVGDLFPDGKLDDSVPGRLMYYICECLII